MVRETDDVQTFYAFGVYEYEMGKTTDARTERSTYVVAGERVAVREQVSNPVSDELTWTFADNLGSASGFVNETTGETGAQRYYPFGHQWVASATDINPTDHGYTGQIRDGATGIYFYNARFTTSTQAGSWLLTRSSLTQQTRATTTGIATSATTQSTSTTQPGIAHRTQRVTAIRLTVAFLLAVRVLLALVFRTLMSAGQ